MIKSKIIPAVLIAAFSVPVLAAETSIELVNDSNSNDILIRENTSGSLIPSAPAPLLANTSGNNIVSSTPGTVDAGTLTYQSCRFNWSVIKVGSFYQF